MSAIITTNFPKKAIAASIEFGSAIHVRNGSRLIDNATKVYKYTTVTLYENGEVVSVTELKRNNKLA